MFNKKLCRHFYYGTQLVAIRINQVESKYRRHTQFELSIAVQRVLIQTPAARIQNTIKY